MDLENQSHLKQDYWVLLAVKVIYALLISMALFFFVVGGAYFLNALMKGGPRPFSDWYAYLFPLFYFIFCYLSCTPLLRGRTLAIMGLVMHTGFALWAYVGGGNFITFAYFIGFTILWIALYVTRITLEENNNN